ncbi:RNA polymerase sigma factor [Aquimarina gracilis]|uniref:RNA polymerase sigma factor n=1 Tax=Aquimarina gracilis TaxID=874422 RepID=A0ABU5ZRU6_9FLAO|nr:RNA polymerase sigma factor [Aquimarina gracilis]MEB3344801.1 RNA polymerase sigma factor [Aquimarina gracilis]
MENPFLKEYKGDITDIQLVNEAKSGNKKSLEKLILKHQPYIYNVAWKMVRNPTDAEDLTQEVNIKVITKLAQFEGKSSFRTWLYRIVANHFLMSKRRPFEKVLDSFDTIAKALDDVPDTPLTELEQQEKKEVIREMNYMCMSGMLLCLTREQRLTFILGEMFNADHVIGSEILGISKDSFRKRLSRARKDIFNFMNEKCGLVNKNNPCRCHKKVTYAIKGKAIDSKNLLYNRSEYQNFRTFIRPKADKMLDYVEEKYHELYQKLPFKKDFDKKSILEDIVNDDHIKHLMNLN